MIRSIKDVIRKEASVDPASYWSDHVTPALIALRHSMSRAHGYPPFTVITGLVPVLPSDLTRETPASLPADAATPEEEAAYVERLR